MIMNSKFIKKLCAALTLFVSVSLLLSSCAPAYKEYHVTENVIDISERGGEEQTSYFFLTDDGSAVLDICNEKGGRLQRFEFPQSSDYYASLDFEYAFASAVFQDMNFDGKDDLYVNGTATTENLEGMAWLWDEKEGEFVLSEELSALYELTVFPDEELITSQDYSNPDGVLCSEYKWEGGKLVKVGEYTVNTAE